MKELPHLTPAAWPAERAGPLDPDIKPPAIEKGSVVDVLDRNLVTVFKRQLEVTAVDADNDEVQVDAREEGKRWVPRRFVRHAIVTF